MSPYSDTWRPRRFFLLAWCVLVVLGSSILVNLVCAQGLLAVAGAETGKPRSKGAINNLSLLNGAVTVSSSEADVELKVSQNGQMLTVTDKWTGQEISINTTDFSIVFGQGTNRLKSSGDTLTLWRGETAIVEVKRQMVGSGASEKLQTPADANVEPREILSGVVAPNGKTLILIYSDRSLRAFDVQSGREVRQFQWPTTGGPGGAGQKQRAALGIVADSGELVSASGGLLEFFDAATLRPRRTVARQFGLNGVIGLSANGNRVASGNRLTGANPRFVQIWDVTTGAAGKSLSHHMDIVNTISLSADGKRCFCGGAYLGESDTPLAELARVWDVETGEVLFQLTPNMRTGIRGELSPDGRVVAAPNLEKGRDLCLWDVETGRELRACPLPEKFLQVHFSPNGGYVSSQGLSGKLRVFAVKTGQQVSEFSETKESVQFLGWSPDSSALIVSDGHGVRRLALVSGEAVPQPPTATPSTTTTPAPRPRDFYFPMGALVFANSGKFAVSGAGPAIRLIDGESSRELQKFVGTNGTHFVRAAAISPDNSQALIAGGQTLNTQRLTLWDIEGWKPVRVFEGMESLPNCAAFTPSGREALCGTAEGNVHVWDVATAKPLTVYSSGLREARAIAVAPDGRLAALACGGLQSRLDLWSVVTGEKVRSIAEFGQRAFFVSFTPDGKSLVSVGEDRTIRVWDVESGKLVRKIVDPIRITSAALSPDGKRVVAGYVDGAVAVWEIETGRELVRYANPTGPVVSVIATSPPNQILSANQERTIYKWPMPAEVSVELSPADTTERRDRSVPVVAPPKNQEDYFEQRRAIVQRSQDGEMISIHFTQVLTDEDWHELLKHIRVRTLGLPRLKLDREYDNLRDFKSLSSLHLRGKLPDSGVRAMANLTNLTSLSAFDSALTDQQLAEWKTLTKLRDLSIHNCRITDDGLEYLKGHFALRSLVLGRSLITGSGLKHLNSLVELSLLSLDSSPVSNDGLEAIVPLQSLNHVRLNQCIGVGDEGLRHLAKLPKLTELHLNETSISDAGLEQLKELKKLKTLGLSATKITDAGLKHLYELPELTTLDLSRVNVSEAAVQELRKQLPKLGRVMGYSPGT